MRIADPYEDVHLKVSAFSPSHKTHRFQRLLRDDGLKQIVVLSDTLALTKLHTKILHPLYLSSTPLSSFGFTFVLSNIPTISMSD